VAYNTGNSARQTVAEILQKDIAAINEKFVIEMIGLPFSDFIRDQREYRLPIFISGWIEDIHDPHNWYVPYLTGSYAHRQRMPEDFIQQFQNLIDQGVSEIDSARRAAIYNDLDQLVYDQAPVIFLATPSKRFYVQRWVEGFYRNPIENSLYYYDLSKQ
jgi:peptide/nickel transport system substrate-binding protein